MKVKNILYAIIAVQFVIALSMWYVSLSAMAGYQTIWTILLALELILLSLLFMVYLRYEGVF
jgi:hypothetical protein